MAISTYPKQTTLPVQYNTTGGLQQSTMGPTPTSPWQMPSPLAGGPALQPSTMGANPPLTTDWQLPPPWPWPYPPTESPYPTEPPEINPEDYYDPTGTVFDMDAYQQAIERNQMWPYLSEIGYQRPELRRFETLTPLQQALGQRMGDYLGTTVGQPGEQYGGQMVAGTSPYEQQALGALGQYMGGEGAPLWGQQTTALTGAMQGQLPGGVGGPYQDVLNRIMSGQGDPMQQDALQRALQGQLPGAFDTGYYSDLFQQGIATPAREYFAEETLPGIGESYQGPGTYWSGARAEAETEARENLEKTLQAQQAQWLMGQMGGAQGAMLQGLGYGQGATQQQLQAAQTGQAGAQFGGQQALQGAGLAQSLQDPTLQQAQAGLQYGALPRALEQQEYERQYQEFLRTRPEVAPQLQYALSLMQSPMMGTFFEQQAMSPGSMWAMLQYPQGGMNLGSMGISSGPGGPQVTFNPYGGG